MAAYKTLSRFHDAAQIFAGTTIFATAGYGFSELIYMTSRVYTLLGPPPYPAHILVPTQLSDMVLFGCLTMAGSALSLAADICRFKLEKKMGIADFHPAASLRKPGALLKANHL